MKTIGPIGGMSWESTVTYYQVINEIVNQELGRLHSTRILLYSADSAEIEKCQTDGDWDKSTGALSAVARGLEKVGADSVVICANTMYKVVPQAQSKVGIPILHIVGATADELKRCNITTVALPGIKYTMAQDFYKERLTHAGITVLIPGEQEIGTVNNTVYKELCSRTISEIPKEEYRNIIRAPARCDAEEVILGCTRIGTLIRQQDTGLPAFDTTRIRVSETAMLSIGR